MMDERIYSEYFPSDSLYLISYILNKVSLFYWQATFLFLGTRFGILNKGGILEFRI